MGVSRVEEGDAMLVGCTVESVKECRNEVTRQPIPLYRTNRAHSAYHSSYHERKEERKKTLHRITQPHRYSQA